MKKLILYSIVVLVVIIFTNARGGGIGAFIFVNIVYLTLGMVSADVYKYNLFKKNVILILPLFSFYIYHIIIYYLYATSSATITAGLIENIFSSIISCFSGLLIGYYFLQKQKPKLLLAFSTWVGLFLLCVFWLMPWVYFRLYLSENMSQKMPENFALIDTKKKIVDSKYFEEKVVLLSIWYVGCRKCWRMFSEIEKLKQKYQGNSTVKILALHSGDTYKENYDDMLKALQKRYSNFPLHFLYDKYSSFKNSLSFEGAPHSFLIDKNGVIRFHHRGYLGWQENYAYNMNREIEKLLKE